MARIAIIMDAEEGHLLPTFGLAHSLKAEGHEVIYLSICDNEKFVTEQGFAFVPVLENIFPKGYRQQYKRRHEQQVAGESGNLQELINGAYDGLLQELKADLYIVSTFLRFDLLLLYYKYNIRPVVFTTYLRDPGITLAFDCIGDLLKIPSELTADLITRLGDMGIEFRSMEELTAPLNTFPELVACPKELDFDDTAVKPGTTHIGPSVRQPKSNDPAVRQLLLDAGNKPLIYASLGSQALSYGEKSTAFFRQLLQLMKTPSMQEMHMLLTIGPELDRTTLGDIPPNVSVVSWISQVDVLEFASMAIIHGGLGTVKECIYYGVPMLVIPVTRDQPSNARRVVQHGLGMSADITAITGDTLAATALQVLKDPVIRSNIRRMQQIFREQQASQRGVEAVAKILSPVRRTEIRI